MPTYLRERQYKDPTNLNARIALHSRFAHADEPWYPWLAGRVPTGLKTARCSRWGVARACSRRASRRSSPTSASP